MNGYLTDEVVGQVRRVLTDGEYREQMVEQNYRAARKYYSYERVERELLSILARPRSCGPLSLRESRS
jgi:spore maturation protein CgeB